MSITTEQREKNNKLMRDWRKKNAKRSNELARQSYARHKNDPGKKEWQRDYHLKRNYGLSQQDYLLLLEKQLGVCLICKEFPTIDRPLYVDHDHDTGEIRGLLCSKCNSSLGWYEKYQQSIKSYMVRGPNG